MVVETMTKERQAKILIYVVAVIFVLLSIPSGSFLLSKIIPSSHPNWVGYFERIAYYTSFGLIKYANDDGEENIDGEDQRTGEEVIKVSALDISVINKRITFTSTESSDNLFVFSALLKNNSPYRISNISIIDIKIYDKNHKIIGEKTDFKSVSPIVLVEGGETPFSYQISKSPDDFHPDSFDIEINIPEFYRNNSIANLSLIELKLVNKEKNYEAENNYKYIRYDYDLTIKNNTGSVLKDIFFIGFLKYKDFSLTREGQACCNYLSFVKKQDKDDLNETQTFTSLNPGETETVRISLAPDPLLYINNIDETKITPVVYVSGFKKDN